ncbi:hypothetical protein HMI55_006475 [Coelomomyces lativittatus]|nr:hypothetical protein HMI55_006475 [Coelomomyces lativittatus]
MGLGKTIQVISFLIQLYHEYSRFPFLLVVPNSTLDNWSRELSVWSPDFLVVVSTGTREDREMIRKYDIFKGPSSKAIKSHIVLTSYESVLLNSSFKNVQWDCLIVDEGHRLKNNKSKLFTFLKDFNVAHKLLLTGTPLQNNIQELFNLMNFMDPKQFPDPEELAMKFKMDVGDEETKKKIDELHTLLRPHFLRRVKADVLKDMPAKAEILVPVRMTQLQKELIKDIYSSNFELLKALGKNAALTKNAKTPIIRSTTLMNILMQCRKVLSHPFLLPEVEEGLGLLDKPDAIHRRLVDSGGKLELLHQMLPKLKANGHKVLIFSQFKTTLDILEDYLTGSEWDYCRFDGDTTRSLRQEYIDTFNSSPEKFVFLLTTRAGGVGLNLTSADTVIIYDSDWNPHQDVQAIARCHRIGQTKPVLAFKFMTVGSVEEKMIAVGNRKMALDHVVVQKMKDSSVDEHDLVELLRYGAKALFEEDNALVQKYNDEDLDRLLDRSQAKPYLSSPPTSSNEDASDSPSSITPSNSYNGSNGFGFSKVWLEKKMDGPELETDEDNWEQLLNKLRKNTSDEVETQGRRKRKIVNYVLPPNTSPKKQKLASKLEPSNQSSESETSLLSLNEADSDTNDYVNEDELHSELSELLVQPSSKSMPSQPYLPPTDLNIQAQLKSDKTRAGMLGKPSESNGLSRARKVRRFGTKKFPLNSAKPPAGDFTNTQTHSPLVLATHQTTHVSTDSLKDSNISSNSHLSPDPHFTYLMPPPVPPPPPSGRLPQSAGGLTAYTFAQQSPCWICAGSIYSSISYHLPIQCPALQDRDFLISRLRAFYAHSPQTSRPAQFFLQKMIQRSSTLVCLICQSTFHHDTAHCPSNKNLDLLLATRHRILSTRQQNSSWIENFNQIEILLKLASKEQSLQRLPNQEK